MKYLALDFGLATVGLAVSEGALAQPYGQLHNTSQEKLLKQMAAICKDLGIETIIIGVSEGKMADITRQFAATVEKHLHVPVILVDETLSSQTATEYLVKSGAKRKKRQTQQHQTAAAIILQSYLDEHEENLL